MIKKILFQDTSFRDGFQSIFGARVLTKDFIPAVEAAVAAAEAAPLKVSFILIRARVNAPR